MRLTPRDHCEGLDLYFQKEQAKHEIEKGTLEGVINILRGQLQQKRNEGQTFGSLLQQLQEIEDNSLPQNHCNPKKNSSEKAFKEQEEMIQANSQKIQELFSDHNSQNLPCDVVSLVTTTLTLALEHMTALAEELSKEREKNIRLIERLDQELENEDTLLVTMDNLEKQISQISSSTKSYTYNFIVSDYPDINNEAT